MKQKVPGDRGLPFFGHALHFFHHANRLLAQQQEKYGDIYTLRFLNHTLYQVSGQNSTKHFLVEHGQHLSSEEGWATSAGRFFPRGLMLLDGEKHRVHRNIMRAAFTRQALASYLPAMEALARKHAESLRGKERMVAHHEIKTLTLEMAMKVFFGLNRSPELDKLNEAFNHTVIGSSSLPIDLPWTKFGRGKRGRAYLEAYFETLVPERRRQPGNDLLSILIQAEDDEGHQLTDQEVIDHAIFLLMAAHDTTASTLNSMLYFSAAHQEWQDKMREEILALPKDAPMDFATLGRLDTVQLVMKETLRMIPPVLILPRVTTADLEFRGYPIPRGSKISLIVRSNHFDGEVFENPEQFDPSRFEKPREEDRTCPHHYSPFGAGAHFCLGFLFAELQIKVIMRTFLERYRWTLLPNYTFELIDIPIPRPKDGLPLRLEALH